MSSSPLELIVGEILANTVEHAPGLVSMEVDWSDAAPVVTVVDTGPGLERFAAQLPEDALTEDGRGLYLVQTLARDVCIESDQRLRHEDDGHAADRARRTA